MLRVESWQPSHFGMADGNFLERQSISNATSAFLRKICELSDGKRVCESVATCSGVCFKSG